MNLQEGHWERVPRKKGGADWFKDYSIVRVKPHSCASGVTIHSENAMLIDNAVLNMKIRKMSKQLAGEVKT